MKARGFSLLEILIALGIMAIALTGVLSMFGVSQGMSRRSEAMMIGTMLARQRMAEVTLDMEKRAAEGRFPQDAEHEDGAFAVPFERYAWAVDVRKVELPIPPLQEAKADLMQLFTQTIAKQIAEAVREVKLTVTWRLRDQERKLTVTTHVVNL